MFPFVVFKFKKCPAPESLDKEQSYSFIGEDPLVDNDIFGLRIHPLFVGHLNISVILYSTSSYIKTVFPHGGTGAAVLLLDSEWWLIAWK
jgi:hypothetical protein